MRHTVWTSRKQPGWVLSDHSENNRKLHRAQSRNALQRWHILRPNSLIIMASPLITFVRQKSISLLVGHESIRALGHGVIENFLQSVLYTSHIIDLVWGNRTSWTRPHDFMDNLTPEMRRIWVHPDVPKIAVDGGLWRDQMVDGTTAYRANDHGIISILILELSLMIVFSICRDRISDSR